MYAVSLSSRRSGQSRAKHRVCEAEHCVASAEEPKSDNLSSTRGRRQTAQVPLRGRRGEGMEEINSSGPAVGVESL